MKKFIAGVALVVLPATTFAQTTEEKLQKCASIELTNYRLMCYDDLARGQDSYLGGTLIRRSAFVHRGACFRGGTFLPR